MTCYWSGLLHKIHLDDYSYILKKRITKKPTMNQLIQLLKSYNRLTHNVIWNGTSLLEKEKEENYEAVRDYNEGGIYNGHLCSTCDYFLLLICEIFNVNIDHYYLGRKMTYRNKKHARKTLIFHSNRGHFW